MSSQYGTLDHSTPVGTHNGAKDSSVSAAVQRCNNIVRQLRHTLQLPSKSSGRTSKARAWWAKLTHTTAPTASGSELQRRRYLLAQLLESEHVTYALIILLIIDTCTVFVELLFLEDLFGDSATTHTAEQTLHCISLSILGVFACELALLLFAFGASFFTHAGYVLDLIVIPTSIGIEITFNDAGSLLILLRFWRIIRISHSVYAVESEKHDEQMKAAQEQVDELSTALRTLYKSSAV